MNRSGNIQATAAAAHCPDTARSAGMELQENARVAVIGGGPAGAFFSYFLIEVGQRVGQRLQVDIYDPKDFTAPGPAGCNMCGGVISESLVQALAAEGINLPSTVVTRGIDSYVLHMDVGRVRIETPLHEMRIGAVHRGGGPRGRQQMETRGFDSYLLELATGKGARLVRERVEEVGWEAGYPRIKSKGNWSGNYELLAVASGVNSSALKLFERAGLGYAPPGTARTYICEFCLGRDTVAKVFGHSMHVFLLNIPRLDFAALIPKGDFVTFCMLGRDIDDELIRSFFNSEPVRTGFDTPLAELKPSCHCAPRINVAAARQPFGDRLVFLGDCGISRLYKDGIGAAYRTAKAAAVTAVFEGVAAADFRRSFWPACRSLRNDNLIGKLVFSASRTVQHQRSARRGMLRMVAQEQQKPGSERRMSKVLWNTFTGSAPYWEILLQSLHPCYVGRFLWETARGVVNPRTNQSKQTQNV
jgi:flavin-dependent dehydrogenase